MKILPFLIPLTLFPAACGQSPETSKGSVIVGSNDLSEAAIDPDIISAIGRLQKGCTASHLGNGLVLTAGHCITMSTCSAAYDISWGITSQNPSGTLLSKCDSIIHTEESGERDFAIYRVLPFPEQSLALDDTDIQSQGPVTALSYPGANPLLSSGPCQLLGPDHGDRWFHDCDTEKGSSGAPLLNSDGHIAAIHNRGSRLLAKNSGTKSAPVLSLLEAVSQPVLSGEDAHSAASHDQSRRSP